MTMASMKKVVLVVVLAGAAGGLYGCGDTCTSAPAELGTVSGSCTSLAANTDVIIEVAVKQNCGDSNPSCVAERTSETAIELPPVFSQCQADSSCATSGAQNIKIPCTIAAADATGSVRVTAVGDGSDTTPVDLSFVSGGATSCTL
jgi:hypothetical protein